MMLLVKKTCMLLNNDLKLNLFGLQTQFHFDMVVVVVCVYVCAGLVGMGPTKIY